MTSFLLWASLLATGCLASPTDPTRNRPIRPDEERLRVMLQAFVNESWGSRFSALGDESDFDHGHLLLDARTGNPVAILYHTRELAVPAPEERSWIQWLDGRGVESAARYERSSYPSSASWDWFVARDLPRYKARHTVVERMLEPALLGFEPAPGPQWTFTRADCADARITVAVPDRTSVCLKTSLL